MARRLIVDTGVLIASERTRAGLADVIDEGDDLVVAAVTIAELRTGIELATPLHRTTRTEFALRVVEALPVEPYGLSVSEAHGRLLAAAHRSGRRRGTHGLIVAATAVATNRILLTSDRRAQFGDLPGVKCIVIQ